MNCPSRADPEVPESWNQSPNALNADATTRADLEHVANAREQQDHRINPADAQTLTTSPTNENSKEIESTLHIRTVTTQASDSSEKINSNPFGLGSSAPGKSVMSGGKVNEWRSKSQVLAKRVGTILVKYGKAVGPGFMIAVAYIDPGNYSTDIAAGASYKFKLLFIVFMSNIFAIFLQSLCIKLGSVTGMNLAENMKAHLPRWLNYVLYFLAESAIVATDIAEVIGTAIALNLLLHIPLVAGCAISIIDVLVILFLYHPKTMRALRTFEIFVMFLVLGVAICFCFELSKITASVGEVFRGYLPSSTLVKPQALFQSCGILGATVMPHSLYLGSGIVQPRLREFDEKNGNHVQTETDSLHENDKTYRPSIEAIKACMPYSIAELSISLFTFALLVNSAILIVAGASLFDLPEAANADLFSIHDLLSRTIAPVAGTMFALALLLSGTSAGIICTIAGQMVSEGQLNWTLKPWMRRLITRSISITPSIIIAGAVGRDGLSAALNGTQVALSVILPFVSAPLLWFTCRAQYMKVPVVSNGAVEGEQVADDHMQMRNSWVTTVFAVLIWGVIVVMNVALLVLVGLGES